MAFVLADRLFSRWRRAAPTGAFLMSDSPGFLRCVGEAVLPYLGEVSVGAVLTHVADDAFERWRGSGDDARRQAELEGLAQAAAEPLRAQAENIVGAIAAERPELERERLKGFLRQIPALLRASLRRPGDSAGRSWRQGLSVGQVGTVLRVLPCRWPQFKPGDRPIANVDWELVELIGQGGFGEVWLARHAEVPDLPRVALKFCLSDAARSRLLTHEAKLIARVMALGAAAGVADGVAQLRQIYLKNEPPCLEYEFVDAGDLASWLTENGATTPATAAAIVASLATTVGHFHRLDPPVVHRDLKPANILIKQLPSGKQRLKVTDFGIAGLAAENRLRAAREGVSQSEVTYSSLRGSHTPLYASPEQVGGAAADPRDDVHALGVIWRQLLLGDLRAGAPTGRRWLAKLEALGVPANHLELMETCFEAAEDRPPNAGELARRVKALSEAKPAEKAAPLSEAPAKLPQLGEVKMNSVGMKLAYIPPGEFSMGSAESAEALAAAYAKYGEPSKDLFADEYPLHRVRLTHGYWVGAHQVTVGQFRRFVTEAGYTTEAERDGLGGWGFDGAEFKQDSKYTWKKAGFSQTDDHPVVNVSWNDAVAYCEWLSRKEGARYRLPTEAEWEYACRAGATTRYSFGDDPEELALYGNVADGTKKERFPHLVTISARGGYVFTAPVGRYRANKYGLYDMHGNVWEWCGDWYEATYYRTLPALAIDPTGPTQGSCRVDRGGGWYDEPLFARSAYRHRSSPAIRDCYLGFRVAQVPGS